MNDKFIRRSWTEIDLEQIRNNYQIYKSLNPNEVMAVVKADAYGHGAVKIAKLLQDEGVSNFAVSNICEAIELRENGIDGLILILGYTPIEKLAEVYSYGITQSLLSDDYTSAVIKEGHKIRCHYAIDTGMNRIGINACNVENCVSLINKAYRNLNLTGIFTHLCVADTPNEDEFTNNQIEKFHNIINRISDLNLPEIHCLNSAGGLWHSATSKFVRLGIVLYGLKPDNSNTLPEGIKPALKWKSVISMIKQVKAGETIGYGRSFTTKKDSIIATIPTGYADGYNRLLSNKGYVIINNQIAPIVGKVCMDQFMVDITDILDAKLYQDVTLIGEDQDQRIYADDMAQLIDSIGYEVVCDISKRVQRKYV